VKTKQKSKARKIIYGILSAIGGIVLGISFIADIASVREFLANITPLTSYIGTGLNFTLILIIILIRRKFNLRKYQVIFTIPFALLGITIILLIPRINEIIQGKVICLSNENTYPYGIPECYEFGPIATVPVPTNQLPNETQLSEISNPELILTPAPNIEDIEIVTAMIETEVKAVSERNLLMLEAIYAPNAVVINHMGTPTDASDDRIYTGWDNIRQLHYVNLFASENLNPPLYLDSLQVQVVGNKATGTQNSYHEDYSIYTLEKISGKWLIIKLEYGNK
jgi:hypothetical protein